MEAILISIIVILGVIALWQYQKRLQMTQEIKYITRKLEEIRSQQSQECIKVVTGNKAVKGLMGTINDLIENNEQNKVKYQKTKHSMQKMLSNVSHDLKTPLTVILGYTEMLQMTGKEKEMVDKIYLKAHEVLELINKFFDLAKLEAGDKQFPITKVNVGELCKLTLLAFYEQLSQEGIEVVIKIPEKNIYALGNEEAITRILNNLISNAFKYGMAGKFLGITVKEEQSYIRVEVQDKGKGIAAQYKEQVFERIFTLEDSRSKAYQGSGLGLTITKHLVETMGGEINLESSPNECTIFSFTLRKAEAEVIT